MQRHKCTTYDSYFIQLSLKSAYNDYHNNSKLYLIRSATTTIVHNLIYIADLSQNYCKLKEFLSKFVLGLFDRVTSVSGACFAACSQLQDQMNVLRLLSFEEVNDLRQISSSSLIKLKKTLKLHQKEPPKMLNIFYIKNFSIKKEKKNLNKKLIIHLGRLKLTSNKGKALTTLKK